MRQDISAGVRAGLFSGLPLGIFFDALATFIIGKALVTRFHSYTVLPNGMVLPFVLAIIDLVYLAVVCLVGVTAGFIFAVVINRFPARSTYVKAIIPTLIIWMLVFKILDHSFRASLTPLRLALAVSVFAFFVGDSVIFAYLFNRWAG